MVQLRSIEESLVYLKAKPPPEILFIEMTQLLISSAEKFQEIDTLSKSARPLITCLVLNENEIEIIENLGLKIDYYLVMPETMEFDKNFITTMRDMADRVIKGG